MSLTMMTKQQVLFCLEQHRRGRSPNLRKLKAAVENARRVREFAKRHHRIVCWRCGIRRDTTVWQADHIAPIQKVVNFGYPQYLAAACADCNRERQKEYPWSDQVARLKSDVACLSHPPEKVFDFLGELSAVLFGSSRHYSLLIGWVPGFPVYTQGRSGWRVEYEAGNKRLAKAGLL